MPLGAQAAPTKPLTIESDDRFYVKTIVIPAAFAVFVRESGRDLPSAGSVAQGYFPFDLTLFMMVTRSVSGLWEMKDDQ